MTKKLNNKLKKYYIFVIGCQQNEHDGVKLSHALNKLGFTESTEQDADIIFVIACAVRQTAVDRIFGKIKVWGKNKKIILTGCVLDSDKNKLAKIGVDFFNLENPKKLESVLNINSKEFAKYFGEGSIFSSSVPIMFGCDNFCSYCATPYTKGRERSRNIKDISNDVTKLVKKGEKNILLLGQNVNSYKSNESSKNKSDFALLLEHLNSIPGDFEVSFISNHPKDMTDDIIQAVADLPKIKKEIHLPVQSGSNKILKAMNRPYTREKYLEIIAKIKKANPNIEITTDVIVGFPGETEKDFQDTVDIFNKVGYKMAYINKYSPRFGTAAYKLGDPIPWKEKQRRWHELDRVLSKTRH